MEFYSEIVTVKIAAFGRFVVVKMSEKITETVPADTPGRSNLPSKSISTLETHVSGLTHSGDVSRLQPTTSMVLRSQTRGRRNSAAILDVEVKNKIELSCRPICQHCSKTKMAYFFETGYRLYCQNL